MFKVSIAIVACVVGFSSAAFAQSQRGAMREACKADFKKFCSGVSPGGGRIVECLNKQHDSLSEACKTALDARSKQ
ncbi:MAG TPA: cysteine rich repeat-containing protein [Bradyrhizobium sp.]|nr:cysteine rich repeat-containing protein [Bradyrhizobium sp.]